MPLSNRDNWTEDPKTGFLVPIKPEVNGNEMVTLDQKLTFLQLFEETYNFNAACKGVGLKRRTLYDHISFDPKFREAYQDAVEGLCDEAESAIVKQMRKGNITAAFGILNCFRAQWRGKKDPADKKPEEKKEVIKIEVQETVKPEPPKTEAQKAIDALAEVIDVPNQA